MLLLDEPTNHLDLDAIEWLQDLLVGWRGALLFVSHDRAFIDAVATRIVELDRGVLRCYPGNFAAYEATKARELEAEALASARADKLLAQEEVWIRKGVEARRTRSVGRVVRLRAPARAARRAARAARPGAARGRCRRCRSGKIVAELDDVSHPLRRQGAVADRSLQRHHPARRQGRPDRPQRRRQDHAAQADPRRAASPRAARCAAARKLQVAYFDQMRDALDLDATLDDIISPGSEWIEIGGQRKHVMSYLGDFLFSPERANSPVRTLSGGERNRLLLARLFALPANVLVLDEPTNDLDIDTLELLEELLQDYAGTVFLVSHDRRFLDNVVTSTIAWEGDPAFGGSRACGASTKAAAGLADAARAQPRGAAAAPRRCSRRRQRRCRAAAASAAQQAQLQGAARARRRCRRGSRRWRPSRRRIAERLADPALYAERAATRGRAARALCADRRRADGRARALGSAELNSRVSYGNCRTSRRCRHRVGAADDQARPADTGR